MIRTAAGKQTARGPAAPGKVWLIGAGPGDPELLTLRAARALREADAIVVDRLVAPAVLEHARPDAEVIEAGKQGGRPCISQERINRLLVDRAQAGQRVARLKGGDPFMFGRGAEEAQALVAAGVAWEVIPGVSAGIAAPAYAGIPLLHRDHASSVLFLTGHAGRDRTAFGCDADTLVVFMCAATIVEIARELLAFGRPGSTPVALIRNGTSTSQEVRAGTLAALAACPRPPLAGPLLAVVGEVVRLSCELRWFGEPAQPLATAPLSWVRAPRGASAGAPASGRRRSASRRPRTRAASAFPARERRSR